MWKDEMGRIKREDGRGECSIFGICFGIHHLLMGIWSCKVLQCEWIALHLETELIFSLCHMSSRLL